MISETSQFRKLFLKYVEGKDGIDVGFGGDPIIPSAITIDLPNQYCFAGNHPRNLTGDARNLYWFKDNSLEYLYSAHLLEDMEDTEVLDILKEWIRVIKSGGYLLLLLPEQEVYEKMTLEAGNVPNPAHKNKEFGYTYILNKIKNLPLEVIESYTVNQTSDFVGYKTYNIAFILQKLGDIKL